MRGQVQDTGVTEKSLCACVCARARMCVLSGFKCVGVGYFIELLKNWI